MPTRCWCRNLVPAVDVTAVPNVKDGDKVFVVVNEVDDMVITAPSGAFAGEPPMQ